MGYILDKKGNVLRSW